MNVYDRLSPLEPLLAGEWRWAGYAAIALPLAITLWALVGRRWRADGTRRCPRCGHAFAPSADFGSPQGVRCTECGVIPRSELHALRRRGRRRVAAAGIAVSAVLGIPLFLWHSGHVFLARVLLPRWVTSQRAEFADGTVLVDEVDPVQEWLDLEPNPATGAWRGWFDDETKDMDGRDAPPTSMWPDRRRIRAWRPGFDSTATSYLGPFVFGADAGEQMPAIGTPGFGGDLDGDGAPDVVIGEVNTGTLGGISWMRLREAGGEGGEPRSLLLELVGTGIFHRDDAHGDWTFLEICHGFRYGITPGAYTVDPLITCTWDADRRGWVPNAARMRREFDATLLDHQRERAALEYADCERDATEASDGAEEDGSPGAAAAAALEALRAGHSGMATFLPCPTMVGSLLVGVLELVTSGNGAQWEEWVRRSWPERASASFRDAFIADVRRSLDTCECATFLRELNGIPEPRPAVGATPRGAGKGG
jgi:hypothetical protein